MTDGTAARTRRPAAVCEGLLAALDAAEGRRQRRKRDTTADQIGLGLKRSLLERAVADDPGPDGFEGWLLERCLTAPVGTEGATRAMAAEILAEWRLAHASPPFAAWLEQGAPSDDRQRAEDAGRD